MTSLVRSRIETVVPSVSQDNPRIVSSDLILRDTSEEIGYSFQTSGTVAIDFFSLNAIQADLDPNEVFIGAEGRNPTLAELEAFVDISSDTTETAVSNDSPKTDAVDPVAALALSPSSSGVNGLFDSQTRGIYIGYEPSTQTWDILLKSNPNRRGESIRSAVESTSNITNLQPIGFTNVDPASNALTDQLWLNGSNGQFSLSNDPVFNNPTLAQSVVSGDFDNDKDLDLYLANAYASFNQPNTLYENQGDGTFSIVPVAGGAESTAVGPLWLDFEVGSKLATSDYDNDGFLDIFVGSTVGRSPRKTYLSSPSQLYKNQGNSNNWLQIDLQGTESNRDGIGAQVRVTSGGTTQLREQNGGTHNFAQNDTRLHFGLAGDNTVNRVEVSWPSGTTQVLNDVNVNQILTIVESGGNSNGDSGGAGNDSLVGTEANDTLEGNDGDDTLQGGSGNDLLRGGTGSDILEGNDGDDTLNGEDDDDLLLGGAGFDFLDGGSGSDTINGNNGNDIIEDSDGRNILEGEDGNDTITGGADIDEVFGGNDEDVIAGNDGDDILNGGEDNDTLEGGNGNDIIRGDGERDRLDGGTGNDTLLGGDGFDVLLGNDDNDFLDGEGGLDTLDGGIGNDTLHGGNGDDEIVGGVGNDLVLESGDFNFTLTNTTLIGRGTDSLSEVEAVQLSAGGSANTIDASATNLNTTLEGGGNTDTILGGSGDDEIKGEVGNDLLTGNTGSDRFSYFALNQGGDTITDFTVGEDLIVISASGFGGGLIAGTLDESQFVVGTAASDSDDRFIYNANSDRLFYDSDGNGTNQQRAIASFTNGVVLSNEDIEVVA